MKIITQALLALAIGALVYTGAQLVQPPIVSATMAQCCQEHDDCPGYDLCCDTKTRCDANTTKACYQRQPGETGCPGS